MQRFLQEMRRINSGRAPLGRRAPESVMNWDLPCNHGRNGDIHDNQNHVFYRIGDIPSAAVRQMLPEPRIHLRALEDPPETAGFPQTSTQS